MGGLVLLVVALVAFATSARAEGPSCEETCSVNRNCSSTGIACKPDDRACTDRARSSNLEVKCEQQCDDGTRFVYCPPDTGRADSGYVWIMLALAGVLAVGGTTLAWVVLRKKS
jgi:hypothetical protein